MLLPWMPAAGPLNPYLVHPTLRRYLGYRIMAVTMSFTVMTFPQISMGKIATGS